MPFPVPPIVVALGLALAVAGIVALLASPRGGRFRALPGWAGFWCFLAPLLVVLSRADRWVSLVLLGVLMFVALREYFFLAPLRQRDRWAILAAYLSVPLALWPPVRGSWTLFLVVVPLAVFAFVPALLTIGGSPQKGTFESAGRLLLGTIAFVFCAAHLGLAAGTFRHGEIEIFGVLALASELPQRLAGRIRPGEDLLRPVVGVAAGFGLATVIGALLGSLAGTTAVVGAIGGMLVAAGATAGGLLAEAVAQDLDLGASVSRLGRGAFLDRAFPAVYAAPAFFHWLLFAQAAR